MTLDPNFPASPYVYALYARDAIPGGTSPRWNDVCPTQPRAEHRRLPDHRAARPPDDGRRWRVDQRHEDPDRRLVPAVPEPLRRATCASAPTARSTSPVATARASTTPTTGSTAAPPGSPTCPRTRAATRRPAPAGPRRRPPPAAARSAPRASAARPASPSSSTARCSGSTRRPATPSRTIRASRARTRTRGGSSPTASATRSGSRSVRARTRPGSATSAGPTGRRSTGSSIRSRRRSRTPGWPCYEGNGQQAGYQSANLDLCASLYTTPTGLLTPYYTYSHGSQVVNGEVCQSGSSSISGLAFYQGGNYPASYANGLFFADHSRNCIWFMRAGSNGLPDKTQISTFISTASQPGRPRDRTERRPLLRRLRRRQHPPRHVRLGQPGADAPSSARRPPPGPSPLLVNLDGTGSTDPEGSALTYAWDLDDDGQYDDSTASKPTVTFTTAGTHTVRLRVTDAGLATGTASRPILVDDALPTPVIDTPAARLTWKVGDTISFTGHATDGQGQRPARERPVVGTGHPALPVELPHPLDPVLDGRRGRLVRGARSRLPVLSRADPDGHRRVEPAGEHDAPTRPANGRPDLPDRPDRPVAGRRDAVRGRDPVHPDGHRRVQPGRDRGQPADARPGRRTSSARGPTAAPRPTRSSPPPRPRPTPRTMSWHPPAPRATCRTSPTRSTANGWGPAEKDKSNGEAAAGDGKPITLNGTVYAKGLGVHAVSDIRYTMSNCTVVHRLGRGRRRGRQHPRLDRLPGLARRRRRLRLGDDDRGHRDQGGQRQHHRQDRPAPGRGGRRRRDRLRPRRLGRRQADLRRWRPWTRPRRR